MYNKDVNNIFDVGCFKDIVLDEMKAEELEKMYHDYIHDNM